jgi:hypothetical protein
VVTYKIEVELDENNAIKPGSAKISTAEAEPIRLLYEVGVNGTLVNELTIKDYGTPTGDGRFYLYTNAWDANPTNLNDPTTNDLTYAYFEPSVENEHYYFTSDTTIYSDENGTAKYTGSTKPTAGYSSTRLTRQPERKILTASMPRMCIRTMANW